MAHQEEFEQFHQEHPEVLTDLVTLTRRFQAAGVGYLSCRAVWEYYRMTRTLERGASHATSLNNNYVPHYTRLLMSEAGLAGVFRTRRLKGEPDDQEQALADYYERERAEDAALMAEFANVEDGQ